MKRWTLLLLLGLAFAARAPAARGAIVDEAEAVALADFWISGEIGSGHTKMDDGDKAARLKALPARKVLYLVSQEELAEQPPAKGKVLAYVVKYQPSGYVVVSAEDRIEPVIAFDIASEFRWDQPELNFGREFVGKTMARRWGTLNKQIADGNANANAHPNWQALRGKLKAPKGASDATAPADLAPMGTFYLLLDTALWNQGWPYNTEVVSHNGGNSAPTGCTATAMAILMRYHQWPITGSGSHSYTDGDGTLRYSHSANFGATTYNWSNMPTTNISASNSDLANLMYQCGVAVEMDYEPGGSGAWPSASSMNGYIRYRGTEDHNSNHEGPIRDCVKALLPVIISSNDHTIVVCGYRDTLAPYYYFNAGWGGSSNGWYNYTDVPGGDTIRASYPYSQPNNWVYVDAYWGGSHVGTRANPYNNVKDGNNAVPWGGRIMIRGAVYSGSANTPILFNKAMLIKSYEGSAVIKP